MMGGNGFDSDEFGAGQPRVLMLDRLFESQLETAPTISSLLEPAVFE
jgi:hypothetical protein